MTLIDRIPATSNDLMTEREKKRRESLALNAPCLNCMDWRLTAVHGLKSFFFFHHHDTFNGLSPIIIVSSCPVLVCRDAAFYCSLAKGRAFDIFFLSSFLFLLLIQASKQVKSNLVLSSTNHQPTQQTHQSGTNWRRRQLFLLLVVLDLVF